MEGFIVKENTKCVSDKNDEQEFQVPPCKDKPNRKCKSKEDNAWEGCKAFGCKMIVNDQSKGELYTVCHGKPVKDTKGSCSWVKGTSLHFNDFNLILT